MTISKKASMAVGGQTLITAIAALASDMDLYKFISLCASITIIAGVYMLTQGRVDAAKKVVEHVMIKEFGEDEVI